jgi:hypothetical protein
MGGMAQTAQHMPGKDKTLSANPRTTKRFIPKSQKDLGKYF